MGRSETTGNNGRVQHLYSSGGKACTPGWLETVKLNFLVGTGCFHNLLSNTIFGRLPTAMREKLEPRDTTTTLVGRSRFPVYGKVTMEGWITNSPISMEFHIRQISDEGILGMSFIS